MYLNTNRNLSDYFAKCFKHCLREKLTVAMGFLPTNTSSQRKGSSASLAITHYYFTTSFPSLAGSVTLELSLRYVGGRAASQP